ncbi:MAG: NADH-ubiquinone oxidoreductase-F iron-sulfur binding region domain-containing protein, partial [Nitrospiria bacterium]
LKSLIYDYGGGPPLGRRVKAVFSGVSSSVIPRDKLDTPLDFDSMAKISGLGSAGLIVYDDSACMIKAALNFSKFLATDSCGQCISCKAGTGRITKWLEMLEEGSATEQTVLDILEDCKHIKGQGHCFVVSQESIVISSIFYHFPEEVIEHVEYGCLNDRHLPLAKIKSFDAATHTFTYDEKYFEKALLEGREVYYPA